MGGCPGEVNLISHSNGERNLRRMITKREETRTNPLPCARKFQLFCISVDFDTSQGKPPPAMGVAADFLSVATCSLGAGVLHGGQTLHRERRTGLLRVLWTGS